MNRPKLYADFNELIESNLVALSKDDTRFALTGDAILLRDGLAIEVYSDDVNDKGEPDNLIASGVVERNSKTDWSSHIKWCCRIDSNGIRHESDLKQN
jgi:hypothetical protein